ncbi:hypothetical protein BN946_scf184747.g23 [Trametes cinnabarina]|uniref:Fe2OG dioxygenase domain-containing protein n=1 Tax=Pycnoporus cinnabarinus TaxID=5643 RepID=A0A060SS55_PYCCI|nr:hypothetical protein BN946_scf184747.g23 [Trametes cinnabarina]
MAPSITALHTNKRKRLPESETHPKKLPKPRQSCPKPELRIVTDIKATKLLSPPLDHLLSSADSDTDSLFDEPPPRMPSPDLDDLRAIFAPSIVDESFTGLDDPLAVVARRTAPPIPGLHFDPSTLLPEALADDLMWTCIRTFFRDGTTNQVMLFEPPPDPDAAPPTASAAGLPACLRNLLSVLDDLLRPVVPQETHDLLFSPSPASHSGPPRARQAIINLYWPGEGISPHVDLLDRYGDGIMGVSLGSGCAMRFARAAEGSEHDASPEARDECSLYLPKGSVLVMTEEARYRWTHGIEKQFEDFVEDDGDASRTVRLERDVRLSITFRWLLPGADVVGPGSAAGSGNVHER